MQVGDAVSLYGREHVIHGEKAIEGGPERMLLVARVGQEPHVFDWWPESSVVRERDAGASLRGRIA